MRSISSIAALMAVLTILPTIALASSSPFDYSGIMNSLSTGYPAMTQPTMPYGPMQIPYSPFGTSDINSIITLGEGLPASFTSYPTASTGSYPGGYTSPIGALSMFGFPDMASLTGMSNPAIGSSSSPVLSGINIPMAVSGIAFPGGFSSPISQPSVDKSQYNGAQPNMTNAYGESDSGRTITLNSGDIIHLHLPARVDQGYIWNLTAPEGLNATARVYPPEQSNTTAFSQLPAFTSIQEWEIKALTPGEHVITAIYKRPWAASAEDKTFRLTIDVI